jgi:hypothetical protein
MEVRAGSCSLRLAQCILLRASCSVHGAWCILLSACDFGTYWYGHCRALSTQCAAIRAECPPPKISRLIRRRTGAVPRSRPRPEGAGRRPPGGQPTRRRRERKKSRAPTAAARRHRGAPRSRPAPPPASRLRPTPRQRRPRPWPRPSTGLSLWPFGISSSKRDPGAVAPGSLSVYTSSEGATAPASGGAIE